ncbi:MAG: archaellin/type IV pilin N-terminal domain-containing protein [Halobacteriales archaeon]|nr:archaellin/type IV pilin N-terminal domain-containing protein [Halobacteriales archaeon]
MTQNRNNDRGQVGVGTLIVFIAMVLVAAIASGVLINAAGLLQTKSAAASEESAEQVSNRIQVVNAIGSVNGTSSPYGLDWVNLTVSLSPSADEVDLNESTIQWTGPSGTYDLTSDDFTVGTVKDDDDSNPVLNERSDRLKMQFNVTAFATDVPAGSTVELRITTESGATTIVILDVPRSLSGQTTVRL